MDNLSPLLAAALITGLNYIGVKKAGEFQLVFTVLKVVMIVVRRRDWLHRRQRHLAQLSAPHFTGATGGIAGFMAALVAALWAYDGWNDLNMVSGEIRHPERNIPIALIAGVGIVAVAVHADERRRAICSAGASFAASPRPASEATAIAVGTWGAAIVSAGMALSMLVS